MTALIPPDLAARGVARLSFSASGDLLIIKATLLGPTRKRQIGATYHEPEWWRPATQGQAEKLADALFDELRTELSRS